MSNNIKLMNCGHTVALGKGKDDNSELDVRIMALCPGNYTDMNGTEVEITSETIYNLYNTYNEDTKKLFEKDQELTPKIAKDGLENFDNRNAPNQLDHDDGTVLKTAGHVIGLMQIEDVKGIPYLFCTVRVKGKENVEPVKDGRRRNISLAYQLGTWKFGEISWVVKGAAVEARAIFSESNAKNKKPNNNLSVDFIEKFATIQQTENILLAKQQALENELIIKKRLIALCRTGKINRATADYIEQEIKDKKINNPEVIKLMETILPNKNIKPEYFNLLNKEEISKMTNEQKVALSATDFIAGCVALKKGKLGEEEKPAGKPKEEDKPEGKPDEDGEKKYGKSHALKHKEIISKMAEAYEKGDVEMAKKYKDMGCKLAEDAAEDKFNLAEYSVDEESKGSDEVKKLSQELNDIKVQLAGLKEEQIVALNKAKDEQMIMLGQFTDKLSENFNNSDVKELLNKIKVQEEGVK